MFKQMGRRLTGSVAALLLTACANPNHADSIYINTSISGELMPGVYGQVNIGSVPDYVMIYDAPMLIVPQPMYAVPLQPIYLYVPPYHAYHWRDHCHYYNACARPVYFVCARDYRPHYFEPSYYNSRHYDPPRVYGRQHPQGHNQNGHDHNRSRETMYQREMNRDSRYDGVGSNRQGGSYYNQAEPERRDNIRMVPNQTEDNRRQDNRRQDNRHEDNRDGGNNRQQFIDNERNNNDRSNSDRNNKRSNSERNSNDRGFNQRDDGNRMQLNSYPGNNTMQIRSENRNRNDARPASYTRPTGQSYQNGGNMRERAQMPVQQQARQPASRPQGQEQRSFSSHQGGGNDNRRREDRRER